MSSDSQYSRAIVESMEEIFGKGFLSPGGPGEVVRAFAGIDLSGASVLDWGCGLGGTAMALARELGAARVLGIDIDPGNLAHAKENIEAAGLDGRVSLQLVEPGPLPLPDGGFDIVFSQAALCHIEQKDAVLADYARVLKPGGRVVCADWMAGENFHTSQAYREWDEILRREGLVFYFATAADHVQALGQAGFVEARVTDESATALALARGCVEHVEGQGRKNLLECLGPDGYERFLNRCRARTDALDDGALQFCHMRARKPG